MIRIFCLLSVVFLVGLFAGCGDEGVVVEPPSIYDTAPSAPMLISDIETLVANASVLTSEYEDPRLSVTVISTVNGINYESSYSQFIGADGTYVESTGEEAGTYKLIIQTSRKNIRYIFYLINGREIIGGIRMSDGDFSLSTTQPEQPPETPIEQPVNPPVNPPANPVNPPANPVNPPIEQPTNPPVNPIVPNNDGGKYWVIVQTQRGDSIHYTIYAKYSEKDYFIDGGYEGSTPGHFFQDDYSIWSFWNDWHNTVYGLTEDNSPATIDGKKKFWKNPIIREVTNVTGTKDITTDQYDSIVSGDITMAEIF